MLPQEWAPAASSTPKVLENAGELRVNPDDVRASFHYRGNGTDLLTQVARAFGVSATLDESVVARPVRFDIGDVDFYTAMRAACAVTHTFWTPLQTHQILVAAESAENHRKFDHMAMRTFYVPGVTTPTDLNNVVTMLRNLFDIRLITPQPSAGTITVRAPQDVLDAATKILEGLDTSRPRDHAGRARLRDQPHVHAQHGFADSQPIPAVQYPGGSAWRRWVARTFRI